jgi:hypothetical protein
MILPLLLVLGCARDEPVLTGIPSEPLLDGVQSAAEQRTDDLAPTEQHAPPPYVRADGVYVDIGYLGGRRFSGSRDVISDQLGGLQERRPLSGERGEELTFDRGTLRVIEDTIYMLQVPLPEPLRRHEALAVAGLPTVVDRYTTLNREYRLYREWGFRRIQMARVSSDSELVTAIEAWRWLPSEHLQRR